MGTCLTTTKHEFFSLHALVELTTSMHEIAVAVDAVAAAAVDPAAAAADRLGSGNGGVNRSSWSKGH